MIILDRFEGGKALIETDGEISAVSRSLVPEDAREGDMLVFLNGRYAIDRKTTQQRREEISSRLKRILKNED